MVLIAFSTMLSAVVINMTYYLQRKRVPPILKCVSVTQKSLLYIAAMVPKINTRKTGIYRMTVVQIIIYKWISSNYATLLSRDSVHLVHASHASIPLLSAKRPDSEVSHALQFFISSHAMM